jgi:hypothetical protein
MWWKTVNMNKITLPEWLAEVAELVNLANPRELAIGDWPGNNDRFGNWRYCGSVDGSNHRLAEDDSNIHWNYKY